MFLLLPSLNQNSEDIGSKTLVSIVQKTQEDTKTKAPQTAAQNASEQQHEARALMTWEGELSARQMFHTIGEEESPPFG